jgi:CheY-like chemotaxis protein
MQPEVAARAFEPFFTTKDVGKGSGLGLSMIFGFVKQSGGHIKIYSEPGHGTTIRMYLPKATANYGRKERALPAQLASQPGGDETILVVEDDPDVRGFLVAALGVLGYRIVAAEDGPAALALLDGLAQLDMVLTDVVMPKGMNGQQVAAAVRQRFPRVKVLYTSGYTANAIVHQGRLDEDVELLSKPYTRAILAQTVRRVLDAPHG